MANHGHGDLYDSKHLQNKNRKKPNSSTASVFAGIHTLEIQMICYWNRSQVIYKMTNYIFYLSFSFCSFSFFSRSAFASSSSCCFINCSTSFCFRTLITVFPFSLVNVAISTETERKHMVDTCIFITALDSFRKKQQPKLPLLVRTVKRSQREPSKKLWQPRVLNSAPLNISAYGQNPINFSEHI